MLKARSSEEITCFLVKIVGKTRKQDKKTRSKRKDMYKNYRFELRAM